MLSKALCRADQRIIMRPVTIHLFYFILMSSFIDWPATGFHFISRIFLFVVACMKENYSCGSVVISMFFTLFYTNMFVVSDCTFG